MDKDASMRIHLHREDDQGRLRRGGQQVDMSNYPPVVVGASIDLIGRPGTEDGIVYRPLRKVINHVPTTGQIPKEPEAAESQEQAVDANLVAYEL